MRDAKADVTDMRAPSKTQNVRRKNMAFDIDAERERTVEELGGLEKDVDMVPVPRRTSQTMPTIRETADEKTSNTKVARAVDPSRPVSSASSCQSPLDAHAAL